MREAQRRAWRALGLGPVWTPRTASGASAAEPPHEPLQPLASLQVREPPDSSDAFATPASTASPESASTASPESASSASPESASTASPESASSAALESAPPDIESLESASPEAPTFPVPVVATMDWPALEAAVAGCTRCELARTRTQAVLGVGPRNARWMIVGEAPGQEEDVRGEPFVGQAGRLLDNMLASLGLSRARDVYIANVLKCRPPANRNPRPEEVAHCEPYLARQIALVDPAIIVVMGRFAAQTLLGTEASIASLRQRRHHYAEGTRRRPVVVTYHPAYLLRNLEDKAKAWADLQLARRWALELAAT